MNQIKKKYGFKQFDSESNEQLNQYLYKQALINSNQYFLLNIAINELKNSKIILPGITNLEKIICEARYKADEYIFNNINSILKENQKTLLDEIITDKSKNKTILGWLKEYPADPKAKIFFS